MSLADQTVTMLNFPPLAAAMVGDVCTAVSITAEGAAVATSTTPAAAQPMAVTASSTMGTGNSSSRPFQLGPAAAGPLQPGTSPAIRYTRARTRFLIWRLQSASLILNVRADTSEVALVQSNVVTLQVLQHVCSIMAATRPGALGSGGLGAMTAGYQSALASTVGEFGGGGVGAGMSAAGYGGYGPSFLGIGGIGVSSGAGYGYGGGGLDRMERLYADGDIEGLGAWPA